MEKIIDVDKEIKKLVDKLNSYPELFALNKQTTKNLKEYFKTNYNCASFPQGFLTFMELTDGVTIGDITLFSINKSMDNYVLQFETYASIAATKEYLDRINASGKENYMFFANDGGGGRFAFNKKENSDQVYYLSKQRPDVVIIYENFYDWLKNLVDITIRDKIESLKN